MLPTTARNAAASDFVSATRAYAAGSIDTAEMKRRATAALSCAEGLRDDECDALGVPRGSSVAHAAQNELDMIDSAATTSVENASISASCAIGMAEAAIDEALAEIVADDDEKARRKKALTRVAKGLKSK